MRSTRAEPVAVGPGPETDVQAVRDVVRSCARARNVPRGPKTAPRARQTGRKRGAGREPQRIRTFRAPHSNAPESGLGAGRETQQIRTFRAPRPPKHRMAAPRD